MTTHMPRSRTSSQPADHQEAKRRNTPAVRPTASARTSTRLIRFRLNPRSSSDQQILTWLQQFAPYYRADAIRTALLTHILRRSVGANLPSSSPTDETPAAPLARTGVPSATAQKLEKMFPS